MNLFKLMSSLGLAIFFSNAVSATTLSHSVLIQPYSQTPPPVPDTGTPEGPQADGGTRPSELQCPAVSIPAIGFMLRRKGHTTQAYPTFWFYLPYTATQIKSVTFVILDEQNNELLPEQDIQIPETAGFIHLSLPSSSPPLEIGKTYTWYFTVNCQSENQEDRISLRGSLERISDTSSAESLTELEWAIEQGRWSDALSLVETPLQRNQLFERISNVSNLDETYEFQWIDLADRPILPCCTLDTP